ncbi:metalloregulator ArsR/SmtB family transcription factor [Streptosporangium sp. NPDC002524]|uniref:ArsR/SmtB family transcription factor n=1 Tax=Streptosporangium sp. NPDC002524 TaxID=3154537 RepID=UPI00331C0485
MSDERCDLLCLDLPHAEEVRARLPAAPSLTSAAERAKALADPSRLRVALALAAGGEMCVCDLAWVCGFAQNLVSHHLRVLRNADLAASRRDGKLVMYHLTATGRALLTALIGAEDLTGTI